MYIFAFMYFSAQQNPVKSLSVWQVEEALEGVKNATNEQDLANRFKEFGKEMVKLNYVAARRQQVRGSPLSPLLCPSHKKANRSWFVCHIQAQGVPLRETAP